MPSTTTVPVTDRPLPALTAEEAATILRRASVLDHGPLRPLLDAEDALSRAHEVPPEVHAAARLLTDFARARATAVVHRIGRICGADVDLGSVLADIKAHGGQRWASTWRGPVVVYRAGDGTEWCIDQIPAELVPEALQ